MSSWFDYILYHTRTQPQTPAVILEDRIATYAMLRGGIMSCAQRLAGLKLDGDGVAAVMVGNPLRHLVLCFALYRLGIVSLSLDPRQSGARDINVATVLGTPDMRGKAPPSGRFIEVTDSWFAEPTMVGGSLPDGFTDSSQIYRHSLTSGSTGQPKIITHTAVITEERIRLDGQINWNRALCLPGLTSMYGFSHACALLANGRTLCFATTPHQNAISMIGAYSIDRIIASPEQLLSLTRAARQLGARPNSLRTIRISGGIPSHALLQSAMIHLCGNITSLYGATEIGGIAEAPASDVISNPGLVGHLLPGIDIEIFDPQGRTCPVGTVGLVKCRRVPTDAAGRAADRQWIEVGDVGCLDSEGRLFLFGRTADMTASKGHYSPNVPPAYEIEHVLKLEWDLADAASIMVEGDPAGEASQIWIGLVQGNDVTPEKVKALALAHGIQLPVRLFHLSAIPRSSNGKLDRLQLKAAMLASTGAPEAVGLN